MWFLVICMWLCGANNNPDIGVLIWKSNSIPNSHTNFSNVCLLFLSLEKQTKICAIIQIHGIAKSCTKVDKECSENRNNKTAEKHTQLTQ